MANARQDHTATRLLDGRVLVAGGDLPDTEIYDPVARVWRPTGVLNTARVGATATLLPDGRVLLAGGTGQIGTDPVTGDPINGPLDTAELYDPATGTWSLTANTMSTPRNQHTATALANGKVLVVGGIGVANALLGATDLFDPATNAWSSCSPPATPSADCPGPLNVPRRVHTATALRDGRVLVAAGKGANPPSPIQISLTSTELYDPATGTWSTCDDATATATCPGPLAIARFGPTSVTLNSGRALVIAGQAFDGTRIASVEEYDPTTGHWGPTGFLGARRTTHQTTLLADGKVLVAGGFGPDAQGTLVPQGEVYDPATRRWAFTAPMIVPRQSPTMTLLADGRVLVTGGRDAGGSAIRQSELFTPTPPPVPPAPAPAAPAAPGPAPAAAPEVLRAFAGCPASTANTISTAPAIHSITATAGADRIFAGDGDDLVNALAGDDCVDLGAGADRGSGDAGDDLLLGDAGNDRLSGGNGDDSMTGDAGNDSVSGGRGDDLLRGGPGADALSGGRGDDRLGGAGGNDRITGGPGRDVITGGGGADRILARDGNRDRIDCGSGRDSVSADSTDRVARNCERVRRR
jgi:Ca2+-binding RTX toxin-like protein